MVQPYAMCILMVSQQIRLGTIYFLPFTKIHSFNMNQNGLMESIPKYILAIMHHFAGECKSDDPTKNFLQKIEKTHLPRLKFSLISASEKSDEIWTVGGAVGCGNFIKHLFVSF